MLDETEIEGWYEDERERLTKEFNDSLKLIVDTTGDFRAEAEAAKKKKKSFSVEEEEAPRKIKPKMTDEEHKSANKTRQKLKEEYEHKVIKLREEYDKRYNQMWKQQKLKKKSKGIFGKIIFPFLMIWKGLLFIFNNISYLKDKYNQFSSYVYLNFGYKVHYFFYRIFKIKMSLGYMKFKRLWAKHMMPYTEIYMRPIRGIIASISKAIAQIKDAFKKYLKVLLERATKDGKSIFELVLKPVKKIMSVSKSGIDSAKGAAQKAKQKYKETHDKVFGGNDDPFS